MGKPGAPDELRRYLNLADRQGCPTRGRPGGQKRAGQVGQRLSRCLAFTQVAEPGAGLRSDWSDVPNAVGHLVTQKHVQWFCSPTVAVSPSADQGADQVTDMSDQFPLSED